MSEISYNTPPSYNNEINSPVKLYMMLLFKKINKMKVKIKERIKVKMRIKVEEGVKIKMKMRMKVEKLDFRYINVTVGNIKSNKNKDDKIK